MSDIQRRMSSIDPDTAVPRRASCRIVRDENGRMQLIRPTPPSPSQVMFDAHEAATACARSLLCAERFPTTSSSAICTYGSENTESEFSSEEQSFDGRRSRYSPYLPDGVPSKNRMRFDDVVEFIRVKILRRMPVTFETKCEAFERSRVFRDRYGRANSVGDKITLNVKRWTGRFKSTAQLDQLLDEMCAVCSTPGCSVTNGH